MSSAAPIRRALLVRGVVQGVGFRPFVHALATRLGVAGWVKNRAGDVRIEVEAAEATVARFLEELRAKAPPLARIAAVEVEAREPRGEAAFAVLESEAAPGGTPLVPPDAATCAACLAEVLDPRARRHRYPFTSCASCGPRFTVIDDLPYDRARTSMAPFAMCAACRREYEDLADRRYRAEPLACPACGPRLRFEAPGRPALEGEEALRAAEEAILEGAIVAVKGLGGYQLCCDAAREEAVARLRERKHRLGKPLAVVVADVAAARGLAEVSPADEAALSGVDAPIVLLRRRELATSTSTSTSTMALAPSVAPRIGTIGVMLPATPLHHLLARDLGRPLVLTSGNRSEEPIAIEDAEARAALGPIADAILLHDRAIRARYDDSVVRVIEGAATPIRRARGQAPSAFPLGREARIEVLALGAHQKCAPCFLRGGEALLGAHAGDLDHVETLEALRAAIATWRRLFRLAPRAVAHDLHPDYLSSEEARRISLEEGLPRVAVQHHHAHLASCLAEHGRDGRAVGLVLDGTGLGADGAIWGGEVLAGDARAFERRGHLRPAPLPGGERTIRRCDRMALAHLVAAAPSREELHAFAARALAPAEASLVLRQSLEGGDAPRTSSAGRLFDAAAALCGAGPEARYEGELAAILEGWADEAEAGGLSPAPLPWEVRGAGTLEEPAVMQPGPLLVALAERALGGEDPRALALAFHESLADMAALAALRVAGAARLATVALSGGCFQSRRLTESIAARLRAAGAEPLVHRRAPPNDGGLALGQAVIAAAALEEGRA